MFKFGVDWRVKVIGSETTGNVEALMLARGGVKSALVEYFDKEGRVQNIWFPESRLETISAPQPGPSH